MAPNHCGPQTPAYALRRVQQQARHPSPPRRHRCESFAPPRPHAPGRPLLRFAALAQPGMINDTIVAEMDARWTPPAGGPLVSRATA